jgi:ApbE superfamily uncharacterized protein (UPF0280 family)
VPGQAAALLADGRRLRLQHGPIDLIIEAWGEPGEVRAAYGQAVASFDGLLETLVEELPQLRQPIAAPRPMLAGPVARRMVDAVWPHRQVFVTPMAAVAGAVADHVLARMVAGRQLARAYVNDGGDVAIHLAAGQTLALGMVADVAEPRIDGTIRLRHADPVRGVATSGRGGRSFSLGIADVVTVLAATAADADAAATLIANEVQVDHPAVRRQPAIALDPDSDLGERPVTVAVGELEPAAIATALERGAGAAEAMRRNGLIEAACLWLRGECRVVGPLALKRGEEPRGTLEGSADDAGGGHGRRGLRGHGS